MGKGYCGPLKSIFLKDTKFVREKNVSFVTIFQALSVHTVQILH